MSTPNEIWERQVAADEERATVTAPVIKTGTIVRFPITIVGFIELTNLRDVRIVLDPVDGFDYAAWPRVSPYGEDSDVVQIDDGPGARRIEADIEIVTSLRSIAEAKIDSSKWEMEGGYVNRVTEGMTYE